MATTLGTQSGVWLAAADGRLAGTRDGQMPLRMLPGDPPACFDIAVGPMPEGTAAADLSPSDIGLEIMLDEKFDYDPGYPTRPPGTTGFVSVSESPALRVSWLPVSEDSIMRRRCRDAGQGGYLLIRACISVEPEFLGRFFISARTPIGALRGERMLANAIAAQPRESLQGPFAWSSPVLMEHGPPHAGKDEFVETRALYYRAKDLGLDAEALDWARLLAEMRPHDPGWLAVQGTLLARLGRHQEARTHLVRALEACEARPGCSDGRSDAYSLWQEELQRLDVNHPPPVPP